MTKKYKIKNERNSGTTNKTISCKKQGEADKNNRKKLKNIKQIENEYLHDTVQSVGKQFYMTILY